MIHASVLLAPRRVTGNRALSDKQQRPQCTLTMQHCVSSIKADLVFGEPILLGGSNGQYVDRIICECENGAVSRASSQSDAFFTNLVGEIIIFSRERMAFRELRDRLQLRLDRVEPPGGLFR
ncbi:hypothetical protein Poly24_55360 [Rosistilla carotiformis]|uniref:Uncharacterized protein n=1 Tax=Rosistilla carotiformis TaxID=2528017 RepID=A0A518K1V4_9BACT|nr:hypothetical protein Poly24_55360 [Rosistilla carotiformis]